MEIKTYRFRTSMGEVINAERNLNFLSGQELLEFNRIGHSGKNFAGEKIGRVEYLNSLRPDKEKFEIEQIKYDKGDFCEEFILIRVII